MDIINAPWLGTVLGIIGIGFALYQIFKSRGPKLAFQYIGQLLIKGESNDLPGGLKILFEDRELKNLSLTQLVLWNRGSASVRGTDIVPHDPLTISFGDDAEVVKVEISKITRDSTRLNASVDPLDNRVIFVTFQFLDQQDGGLIKIWHTGPNTKPKVLGTVVGIPKGAENLGRMPPRYSRKALRARSTSDPLQRIALSSASLLYSRPLAAPAGATVLGLIGFATLSIAPVAGYPVEAEAWWLVFATAGLYLVTGLMGVWMLRRRYPAAVGPDELGG